MNLAVPFGEKLESDMLRALFSFVFIFASAVFADEQKSSSIFFGPEFAKWERKESTILDHLVTIYRTEHKSEAEHYSCSVTTSRNSVGVRTDTVVLAVFELRSHYYIRQFGVLKILQQIKQENGEYAIQLELQMHRPERVMGNPVASESDNDLFKKLCGSKLAFLPSPLGDIMRHVFAIGDAI